MSITLEEVGKAQGRDRQLLVPVLDPPAEPLLRRS